MDRIPHVAPGRCTMRLVKPGFHPLTRREIQVRVGQTVRVDVELMPEVLEEGTLSPELPSTGGIASPQLGVRPEA